MKVNIIYHNLYSPLIPNFQEFCGSFFIPMHNLNVQKQSLLFSIALFFWLMTVGQESSAPAFRSLLVYFSEFVICKFLFLNH